MRKGIRLIIIIIAILILSLVPNACSNESVLWETQDFDQDLYPASVVALESSVYVGGFLARATTGNIENFLWEYSLDSDKNWLYSWDGPGIEGITDMAVYASAKENESTSNEDALYLTGYTSSFGWGDLSVFIVRLDLEKRIVWQRVYGGSSVDRPNGIAVDSGGNVYVTGNTRAPNNKDDIFLLKLSPLGELIWQRTWGDIYTDSGHCVAVDSADNVIIIGKSTHSELYAHIIPLLKFNPSGELMWQKNLLLGNSLYSFREGLGLTVDSSNNIILTGYNKPESEELDQELFIVKYSSSGNLLWSKAVENVGTNLRGTGIAVDSSDTILVTGYVPTYDPLGDIYQYPLPTFFGCLMKLSSDGEIISEGTLAWKSLDGWGWESSLDIYLDHSDNFYVTGNTHLESPEFISLDISTYDLTLHQVTQIGSTGTPSLELSSGIYGVIEGFAGYSLTAEAEGWGAFILSDNYQPHDDGKRFPWDFLVIAIIVLAISAVSIYAAYTYRKKKKA